MTINFFHFFTIVRGSADVYERMYMYMCKMGVKMKNIDSEKIIY